MFPFVSDGREGPPEEDRNSTFLFANIYIYIFFIIYSVRDLIPGFMYSKGFERIERINEPKQISGRIIPNVHREATLQINLPKVSLQSLLVERPINCTGNNLGFTFMLMLLVFLTEHICKA